MKKIEIIWRDLLYQTLEKGVNQFQQQQLAKKYHYSLSTVFQALKIPRKMGAVSVTGKGFSLKDPEKLLYYWASLRNLEKDIIYQTRVDENIFNLEANMVPKAIFGCYSAFRLKYKDAPADYDKAYVYAECQTLIALKKRFPSQKGRYNLIVLKSDPYLAGFGQTSTLAQMFVDIWNLPDWYSKEFINSLKKRINAILS